MKIFIKNSKKESLKYTIGTVAIKNTKMEWLPTTEPIR